MASGNTFDQLLHPAGAGFNAGYTLHPDGEITALWAHLDANWNRGFFLSVEDQINKYSALGLRGIWLS